MTGLVLNLGQSCDRKKLTVQFFWQVPGNYNTESRIDLHTELTPSEGLDILADGNFLAHVEKNGSIPRIRAIRSGGTFTFTTEDLRKHPGGDESLAFVLAIWQLTSLRSNVGLHMATLLPARPWFFSCQTR